MTRKIRRQLTIAICLGTLMASVVAAILLHDLTVMFSHMQIPYGG